MQAKAPSAGSRLVRVGCRQVLVRLEVGDCYRFTSRNAVYSRIRGHLDECPVMAANRAFAARPATRGVCDSHEKPRYFNTYETASRDRPLADDPDSRRRRRSAPGLADGRRTDHAGGAWAAAASGPTSARATAAPREARSGRGNYGGAPTAIRGRRPFCRFAPSGPRTPGAKTRRAAITTSRCGWIANRAATGSRATTTSTISSSRSTTTRAPRIAGRGSAVFLHLARDEFFADRGLRLDDEIGDAAAVGAAGPADQDRDRMSVMSEDIKTMLDQNQIAAASRTLHDHWRAGTKLAASKPSHAPARPRGRLCDPGGDRTIIRPETCSAGRSPPPARPGRSTSMSTARWPDASCPRR